MSDAKETPCDLRINLVEGQWVYSRGTTWNISQAMIDELNATAAELTKRLANNLAAVREELANPMLTKGGAA